MPQHTHTHTQLRMFRIHTYILLHISTIWWCFVVVITEDFAACCPFWLHIIYYQSIRLALFAWHLNAYSHFGIFQSNENDDDDDSNSKKKITRKRKLVEQLENKCEAWIWIDNALCVGARYKRTVVLVCSREPLYAKSIGTEWL